MSATDVLSVDVSRETKVAEFTKKEQMRCMFCGGSQCPKCSEIAYLQQTKPAIDKLHSSWISDSILAMQRPSDSILDNGVLNAFVANKITAVFNLTQPGEHPYCGCGILSSSGFPYSPEKLMHAGIKHFNYSWQDMTVPPISLMHDIVNIACDEIAAGGKVAVHCHAGFGRTGLTIACIMIAKDHLDSSQVITFIRKRRPGSIQTAAQEKFIQRFERSFYHLMHVFPMYEITDKNPSGNSLYSKTIAQSVKDQQYVMSSEERKNSVFKYKHKLVHVVVGALSKLSQEDFHLATLAITGLTKLVPKANRSESNSGPTGTLSPALSVERLMSPTSGSRRVREHKAPPAPEEQKVTCLMVASNSLSESTEEPIMNDMKLEINTNNYAKLLQVAEIVASNMSSTTKNSTSFRPVVASVPLIASPSSAKTSKSLKESSEEVNGDIAMHASRDAQEENSEDVVDHGRINNGSSSNSDVKVTKAPSEDRVMSPLTSYLNAAGVPQITSCDSNDDRLGDLLVSPRDLLSPRIKQREHNDSMVVIKSKISPKLPALITAPMLRLSSSNLGKKLMGTSSSNLGKGSSSSNLARGSSSTNLGNNEESGVSHSVVNSSRNLANMNLGASSSSLGSVNSFSSSGGGGSGGSHSMARGNSFSLLKHRANSLKGNSANDYAKSKRVSTNLMGQMLLDWLETRKNPLFEDKNFEVLDHLWRFFRATAAVDTPFVKRQPVGRTEAIAAAGETLFQNIKEHLETSMDRFKLELLNDIIQMLRQFRVIGKLVYEGEVAPIDCLVCLRLAIACIHGKKQYFGLVKNRALNIDLVKSFLLKATHMDRVVINNITFNNEHYEVIRNTIGAPVLDHLEMVINTFEVLIEYDWKYEVSRESVVHWDELRLAKSCSQPDLTLSTALSPGNSPKRAGTCPLPMSGSDI